MWRHEAFVQNNEKENIYCMFYVYDIWENTNNNDNNFAFQRFFKLGEKYIFFFGKPMFPIFLWLPEKGHTP